MTDSLKTMVIGYEPAPKTLLMVKVAKTFGALSKHYSLACPSDGLIRVVALMALFSIAATMSVFGQVDALKSEQFKMKEKLVSGQKEERSSHSKRDGDWIIRPSTVSGEAYTDCLFFKDRQVLCRIGGFAGAYSTRDRSRFFVYSSGGYVAPRFDKAIFVFNQGGELMKKIEFPPGGMMSGTGSSENHFFVGAYQSGDDTAVEAYDFDGLLLWRNILQGLHSIGGSTERIFISPDGKTIVVASDRNLKANLPGKAVFLSARGEVEREIEADSAKITIIPGADSIIVSDHSSLQVVDLKSKKTRFIKVFDKERDTVFDVQDVAPNGRKIVVSKMRRDDPKLKTKARLEEVILIDVKNETISSHATNDVEWPASVKFLDSDRFEARGKNKTLRYEP